MPLLPPADFGWNMVTLTWAQVTGVEVALSVGVYWLITRLKPAIDRMPKFMKAADAFMSDELTCPHCGGEL